VRKEDDVQAPLLNKKPMLYSPGLLSISSQSVPTSDSGESPSSHAKMNQPEMTWNYSRANVIFNNDSTEKKSLN
jgi:hypothetical protein